MQRERGCLRLDRFIEIRRDSGAPGLVSLGVFRCNSVGRVLMRLDFAWMVFCPPDFGVNASLASPIRGVGGLVRFHLERCFICDSAGRGTGARWTRVV